MSTFIHVARDGEECVRLIASLPRPSTGHYTARRCEEATTSLWEVRCTAQLPYQEYSGLWDWAAGWDAREKFEREPVKVAPGEWRYRTFYIDDSGPPRARFAWHHLEYDGAPLEDADGPPADKRAGNSATLEDAKRDIDTIIEEGEA